MTLLSFAGHVQGHCHDHGHANDHGSAAAATQSSRLQQIMPLPEAISIVRQLPQPLNHAHTYQLKELEHISSTVEGVEGIDISDINSVNVRAVDSCLASENDQPIVFDRVKIAKNDARAVYHLLQSRPERLHNNVVDLTQRFEDHGDHNHGIWQSNVAQNSILGAAVVHIGQNGEGCPCCTAGLDFDEFAAAFDQFREQSQIQNGVTADGGHHLGHLPDFDSPLHWGIFLGLSAPFALIGLCAASRNIRGGLQNRKNIIKVIQGLDLDIKANTDEDTLKRLKAFRHSLVYSKFDTDWNIVVPGFINGAASSLVLSTVAYAHPFALGAIAAYSTAQMGRNMYDFARNVHYQPRISPSVQQDITNKENSAVQNKAYEGFAKATQITRHKSLFFVANATNFAIFSAGAVLTLLSIPAVGVAGLGLPTMIGGLAMLTYGATTTGIGNNIWPRKFRPRNGDIRLDRRALTSVSILLEINKATVIKRCIKNQKKQIFTDKVWTKRWLKVKTALPELKDFSSDKIPLLPKIVKILSSLLFFLPNTGSAALAEKHRLNKKMVHTLHDSRSAYSALHNARNNILAQLAQSGDLPETLTSDLGVCTDNCDDQIQRVWQVLSQTKHGGHMLETWLNEGYAEKQQDTENLNTCCGIGDTSPESIAGISEAVPGSHTFSMEDFIKDATPEQKKSFLLAVDYHLFFVLRNAASYTERSLVDFYALTNHTKQ